MLSTKIIGKLVKILVVSIIVIGGLSLTTNTATADDEYNLTANNGSGDNNHANGTSVSITANVASSGKHFKNDTSTNGGEFADTSSKSTTFTMPANNVTTTANHTTNDYTVIFIKGPPIAQHSESNKLYTLTVYYGVGGGKYAADESVTITANQPAEGLQFSSWVVTGGGTFADVNSATTTYTMPSNNATITANVGWIYYDLIYTTSESNGTIEGNNHQIVKYGENGVLVTAVANTGYHFSGWSDGVATATRTDLNVKNDINVTANFTSNTNNNYTLTVNSGTGAGNYFSGTSVAITASTPPEGQHFLNWTTTNGGTFADANSQSTTFTMPASNVTITANYALNDYVVTFVEGAHGNRTGGGELVQNISDGGDAIAPVITADAGWEFTAWDNPFTNVESNLTVTAQYSESGQFYNLTVYDGVSSGEYAAGELVTITANEPAEGLQFSGWVVTGGGTFEDANSATTIYTMPANNATITANVGWIYCSLTFNAGAHGSIIGSIHQTVQYGQNGTEVTAVADAGYHFIGWSDGVATATRTDLNVKNDINVTANFEGDTYTVTFIEGAHGSRTGGGELSQSIPYGEDAIEPTITADNGWEFTAWDNPFTNVESNLTVTALYNEKLYTLTVNSGIGSGSYPAGANVEISADATYFINWTTGSGGSFSNASSASTTYTMPTNNAIVTAHYEEVVCILTYTAETNGSISGTTSQTVFYGNNGEAVTAIPDEGYEFDKWSDGNTGAIRQDTNVHGDIAVTASFKVKDTSHVLYVSWDGTGDYNCDGTGDQEEINAALAYAASNDQYTTVYIKGPHTYSVNQPIAMPSNMKLTGDATAKVLLVPVTSTTWPGNKPMIYPAGQKYWESHDSYTYDLGTALYGKNEESIDNVEISGFELCGGIGQPLQSGRWNLILIQFYRANNIKIHDMNLNHAYGDIIRIMGLSTRSTNVEIYNNIIDWSGHEGAYLVRVDGVKCYNNEIYEIDTNAGLRIHDCSKIEVYGNTIGHDWNAGASGYAGIYICINGFEPEWAEIYDNYVYGRDIGILIQVEHQSMKGEGVHIHHNRIFNTINYYDYYYGGINVIQARDVLIEYNTIEGSTRSGIRFYFENIDESLFPWDFTTTVRNNIINNCATYGIESSSTSGKQHFEISNNNIYNCGSGYYRNTFTTPVNDTHYQPLYANTAGNNPNTIDLHQKSQYGRWTGNSWVNDTVTSPLLLNTATGTGYGAYGNTPYASKRTGE